MITTLYKKHASILPHRKKEKKSSI